MPLNFQHHATQTFGSALSERGFLPSPRGEGCSEGGPHALQADSCPCTCTLCTCVRLHAYLPQHLVLLIVRCKAQEASQIVQGKNTCLHTCASGRHRVSSYMPIPYCTILLHIYTETDRPIDRQTYICAHMHRAHQEAYLHACMHACSYIRGSILPAVLVCMIRHITRCFGGWLLGQICLLACW